MGEGSSAPENSSALPAPGRLDSWKEIATYLQRDIRTVQRWEEEEALPVHRHQHNRQASVYAFKSELDAWRAERKPDQSDRPENGVRAENGSGGVATNGDIVVEPQENAERSPQVLRAFPLPMRVAIGALLVLAIGAYIFQRIRDKAAPLESVWLQENNVIAADQKNRVAWTYKLPFQARGLVASALVPDSGTQKGARGLAGLFDADPNLSDRICFFSAKGDMLWQFFPAEAVIFGPENYVGPWRGAAMKLFTSAGRQRIAASFQHELWWPSMLFVMDLDGRTLGRFVNSGWIRRIELLEEPDRTLLLLFGVNNAYDGGMMATLDANHVSGASPSPSGSAYECTNCPPGQPLKYFVFPRSELNMLTASPLNTSRLRTDTNDLVVVTFEVEDQASKLWSSGVFRFSRDFQLLSAIYDDRYWEQHHQLELQGKIHHTKANCPDRFGPQSVRAWDPEHGWTVLHPNQK